MVHEAPAILEEVGVGDLPSKEVRFHYRTPRADHGVLAEGCPLW